MHKNNCFDLMRLFSAVMVVVFHHNAFMGQHITDPTDYFAPLESIWVQIFISLSGFLVTQSWINTSKFIPFMWKRVKRLFPALVFCAFIINYVIAPFIQNNVIEYLFSMDTLKNFVWMSLLHGSHVPGLWDHFGWSQWSNPPLWTLAYEFSLYIILGVVIGIARTWKTPMIGLCVCLATLIIYPQESENIVFYGVQAAMLAKLGVCFFVGSLLNMTMPSWNNNTTKIIILFFSVLMMITFRNTPEINIIGRLAIAFISVIIGVSFSAGIFKKIPDISYGIYIWSWPMQAIIVSQIKLPFYLSLLLTLLIVSLIALFSSKFIEAPFLKRKRVKN
ncbi:acyltransferase [Citrobacter amalonaticus]|uniref:acyltransferase family protein n=1 Tax=Citrobacter amalonaticus TaxID=35703 RepID=UPI00300DB447